MFLFRHLRHLRRQNRLYTLLNLAGMALGLTGTLLIGLWLQDEWTFDRYHKDYGNISQVLVTRTVNGVKTTDGALPIPLATELKTRFEKVALTFPPFVHTVAFKDKRLTATGVWTQRDLPEMLTLKMSQGRRDALNDPSSVLIAQSTAKALFGAERPLGRTIRIDNMTDVQVAGVFEDLPRNTTFHDITIFLPWDRCVATIPGMKEAQTEWGTEYFQIYVEGDKPIGNLLQPHVKTGVETLSLYPMSRWRLYEPTGDAGRITEVRLFALIGVFVLLLACINYMNLNTARSGKRAKEAGIRKTIGARRRTIAGQFLQEAALVSLLAGMLAIGLTTLCLPYFNLLTGKDMTLTWEMACALITTATLAGLISGSYPAFYFSSVNPIKAIKAQSARIRQTLVVIQFTITIALALGTVVVYRQVRYAQRRPVGYARGGLIRVTMNTADMYGLSYNALRSGLLATGAVTDMAESSIPSTTAPTLDNDFSWEGKPPGYIPRMGVIGVTFDYGRTMQWQIREGRGFDRSFPSDTGGVVINEAAQRLMGFRVTTGKIIYIGGIPRVVLGVVRDMVMGSPYAPVQPTIFSLWKEGLNAMVVRLNPAMPLAAAIDRAARVFRKFNPEAPFDYHFTDEEYAQKFEDEQHAQRIATWFTGFALCISCLGLFGMASFTAEQRTKEIAIRKVLGATVASLWALLSLGFARLVVIASAIALPINAWVMHRWLQHYAYKTTMPWWLFVLVPAATLSIALATVGYQSLKAAVANPVKALKS